MSGDTLATKAIAHAEAPAVRGRARAVKRRANGDEADAPRLRFIPDDEFETRQPPGYLIERILPLDAEVKIVGDSGSGKTFVALSMAMAIATGTTWLGQYQAKRGLVAYIVAEGVGGFPKRIRVTKFHFGIERRAGIWFLPAAVQMDGREGDEVDALLEAIKALPAPPIAIIIDTQNRCMEGKNENDSGDIGQFLAAVSRLREETHATVIVIHHTGWDSGRERGHSSQRGAADTVVLVRKGKQEDEGPVVLECIKQKDDEPFESIQLKLNAVQLKDGVESCVAELASPDPNRLSEQEQVVLRALAEFEHGATRNQWFNATGMPDSTFRRWREAGEEKGFVTTPPKKRGALIELTHAGRAALALLPATSDGGDEPLCSKGFSPPRQIPPRGRQGKDGGDHFPLPPPPLPLGRGGVAGKAARQLGVRESALRKAPEQRDNSGALRRVITKATERSPDYAGAIVLGGADYRLSAWARNTKNKGRPYLSLTVRNGSASGTGRVFLRDAKNSIYRGDLIMAGVTYELAGHGVGDGPATVLFNARKIEEASAP